MVPVPVAPPLPSVYPDPGPDTAIDPWLLSLLEPTQSVAASSGLLAPAQAATESTWRKVVAMALHINAAANSSFPPPGGPRILQFSRIVS